MDIDVKHNCVAASSRLVQFVVVVVVVVQIVPTSLKRGSLLQISFTQVFEKVLVTLFLEQLVLATKLDLKNIYVCRVLFC
jgi:hypothetical protein